MWQFVSPQVYSKLKLAEFKNYIWYSNLSCVCYHCETFTCLKFSKPVFDHHYAICCDLCNNWIHLKCSSVAKQDYSHLNNKEWICSSCYSPLFSTLNNDCFLECMDFALKKFTRYQLQSPQHIVKFVQYATELLGKKQ